MMALFGIRFDFRSPSFAQTTMTERYAAALEMTEWAERLGFAFVGLAEHHGSDDGYLPSPLPLAGAIAARTARIRIGITAMVASFHDPLRLAEDAAIVDLLSAGRLDLTITNGYVASEFDMFDRRMSERAARTTEMVHTLRRAWTGEPFDFRGRTVRVTPKPHQEGGPPISMGGSTEVAARRAARIGDGFIPSTPDLWAYYRDEVIQLGRPDPGPWMGGDTSFFQVTQDAEQAWAQIAPYAMHEANAYGAWMVEAGTSATGGYQPATDPESLRQTGQYRTVTPGELVAKLKDGGPYDLLLFHPMMGGIPPALAWESLRLFEHEVLPHL